jgi:hypothetical protein
MITHLHRRRITVQVQVQASTVRDVRYNTALVAYIYTPQYSSNQNPCQSGSCEVFVANHIISHTSLIVYFRPEKQALVFLL